MERCFESVPRARFCNLLFAVRASTTLYGRCMYAFNRLTVNTLSTLKREKSTRKCGASGEWHTLHSRYIIISWVHICLSTLSLYLPSCSFSSAGYTYPGFTSRLRSPFSMPWDDVGPLSSCTHRARQFSPSSRPGPSYAWNVSSLKRPLTHRYVI